MTVTDVLIIFGVASVFGSLFFLACAWLGYCYRGRHHDDDRDEPSDW